MKASVKADIDTRPALQVANAILSSEKLPSEPELIRSFSSLAWVAAHIGMNDGDCVTPSMILSRIVEILIPMLSTPGTIITFTDASELLWSFARSSTSDTPEALHRLVEAIEMSLLSRPLDGTVREYSTIMWSLARLNTINDLFRLCETSLVNFGELPPATIATTCSALAKARRLPPPKQLWPPKSFDGMTVEHLGTVVKASATLGWDATIQAAVESVIESADSFEEFIDLLLALSAVPAAQDVFNVSLDKLLPSTFHPLPSSTGVALVTLLSRSTKEVHQRRVYEACELIRLGRLSCNDCCTLVSAMAKSGLYDGRIVDGVRKQIENRLLPQLLPYHKANLMKAYAILQPSVVCDFWDAIGSSRDLRDARIVAAVCWALGNRSLPTADKLGVLLPAASQSLERLDGIELANVARAFAKHKVKDHALVKAMVDSLLACPPRLDDRARCSLLWSLRRLGGLSEGVIGRIIDDMGSIRDLAPQDLTAIANATDGMVCGNDKVDEIKQVMEELLDQLATAIKTGDISQVEKCEVGNVGPAFVRTLLDKLKIPYEVTTGRKVPHHHIGVVNTNVKLTVSELTNTLTGANSTMCFGSGSESCRPRAYEDEIDSPSKSFGGHDRSHHGELKALRYLVAVVGGETFERLSGEVVIEIDSQHPCVSCIAAIWRTSNILCPDVTIKLKFPLIA
ncbi:hypothetical protein FOL47_000378 [Perkinsus chesapeaki]|uniref:Uncharacterized protein n=1 Tax=Perkinsus chesapeaki TaxID=330153 RepID=A0A7J6MM12_PERCH|nr:hypothetical protein FOL47_000378 [Perkinsus chesapeaki]